jgi:hypothetical protein
MILEGGAFEKSSDDEALLVYKANDLCSNFIN